MKRLMMVVMLVVVFLGAGLNQAEAAPYPTPLIQDSEFIPRYDGSGNPLINYRLAQFAAKLATQVYGDDKYEISSDGNKYYEASLKAQSYTLLANGFEPSNIWLINYFDDAEVKALRQSVSSLDFNNLNELENSLYNVYTAPLELKAKASVQALIAKKEIVYNGVKRNVWAIVFRGTQGFTGDGVIDWALNLSVSKVPFNPVPDAIEVHAGFASSVKAFEAAW